MELESSEVSSGTSGADSDPRGAAVGMYITQNG